MVGEDDRRGEHRAAVAGLADEHRPQPLFSHASRLHRRATGGRSARPRRRPRCAARVGRAERARGMRLVARGASPGGRVARSRTVSARAARAQTARARRDSLPSSALPGPADRPAGDSARAARRPRSDRRSGRRPRARRPHPRRPSARSSTSSSSTAPRPCTLAATRSATPDGGRRAESAPRPRPAASSPSSSTCACIVGARALAGRRIDAAEGEALLVLQRGLAGRATADSPRTAPRRRSAV